MFLDGLKAWKILRYTYMSCRMNNGFPINQRYPENSWPSALKGWLGETSTFSIHGMESMCCFTAHTSSQHQRRRESVGNWFASNSCPFCWLFLVFWLGLESFQSWALLLVLYDELIYKGSKDYDVKSSMKFSAINSHPKIKSASPTYRLRQQSYQ